MAGWKLMRTAPNEERKICESIITSWISSERSCITSKGRCRRLAEYKMPWNLGHGTWQPEAHIHAIRLRLLVKDGFTEPPDRRYVAPPGNSEACDHSRARGRREGSAPGSQRENASWCECRCCPYWARQWKEYYERQEGLLMFRAYMNSCRSSTDPKRRNSRCSSRQALDIKSRTIDSPTATVRIR